MTDAVEPTSNGISQTDYLKLFMQELTYQDPLKPIDNKEFMAQMAQFSNLQVAQETKELLGSVLGVSGASQAISLLGKTVRIKDAENTSKVTRVTFTDQGPKLQVELNGKTSEIFQQDIEEIY